MFRRSLLLSLVLMVASCIQQSGSDPDVLDPKVNTELRPRQLSIPDSQGAPQPVGSSRDAEGVQSDFLEGLILVRPKSDAELASFIARYEGTVIRDDTIPEPPAALGVTLTAEQRKPTEYVVRINLAKVDASSFAANATAAGLTGVMEFSSQSAMLTLAGVAETVAAGSDASPNYIAYPDQIFPATLFATQERSTAGVVQDAFTTGQFGIAGSQSNVTKAWQFLSAHGIRRRVRVAILDRGFWLNPDGTARSATDSDFPAGVLTQYDFDQNDAFADGPNLGVACGENNPCFWHGTGSAGVAMGLLNNKAGAAGTGGQRDA